MRNIALIVLFLLSIDTCYSQDAYLKKMGITMKEFHNYYDSINRQDANGDSTKNIILGEGEFFYVNNDTCFIYEEPRFWETRKIDTLTISDSIYVFKDTDGKPLITHVGGRGFGYDEYTLCITKKGKLGLFLDTDCISRKKHKFSPDKNFYLTTNWLSSLLISTSWDKYYKIPTWNLIWFSDSSRFLYNNCFVDCDTSSVILELDLKNGKNSFICKGVAPFLISRNETIMYFRDSTIKGVNKECVFTKDLKSGKIDLFFQIPDSLSYWSNGDDYRTPTNIAIKEIDGDVCFRIYFYPRDMDMSCDHPYVYYINRSKKIVKIEKI